MPITVAKLVRWQDLLVGLKANLFLCARGARVWCQEKIEEVCKGRPAMCLQVVTCRRLFVCGKGAWCHLFKHGYEILEQKSKAGLRLRTRPLVQCSAKNPGFPDKGLAQHFATVPVVKGCKVLKNVKHFAKESSLRVTQLCPLTHPYVMKLSSAQHYRTAR